MFLIRPRALLRTCRAWSGSPQLTPASLQDRGAARGQQPASTGAPGEPGESGQACTGIWADACVGRPPAADGPEDGPSDIVEDLRMHWRKRGPGTKHLRSYSASAAQRLGAHRGRRGAKKLSTMLRLANGTAHGHREKQCCACAQGIDE